MIIYLVVGAVNCPGRVFASFEDEDSAWDYRQRYLLDEATVEERELYSGRQLPRDNSFVLP